MDPLHDVFAAMRVEKAMYARLEARAPWGLSTRRGEATRFGLVLAGTCLLTLEDETALPPVRLASGDCFFIPHGSAYTLRDHPHSSTINCVDVIRQNEGATVHIGGEGAATAIVSGWFIFDRDGARPLMESLPPLLHIAMRPDRAQALQASLQLLAFETSQSAFGSGLAVSRLADIIFVQAVRAYVETLDSERDAGWLAALSDRKLGKSLAQLHKDLAADWTVDRLAKIAGMSRSAFAARFRDKVGSSPLEYITKWRIFKASHLLKSSDRALTDIAAAVGYESAPAFNKAFKRSLGTSPGSFRRQHRSPGFDAQGDASAGPAPAQEAHAAAVVP